MKNKYNIYELTLMVVLGSFVGYLFENCWLAITEGYIDNRNMNLPFLLGYGLAIVSLYIFLGTPEHPRETKLFKAARTKRRRYLRYFLTCTVLVSVGEVILGTIVEQKCGFEYWDYSQIPMHITKYTSVPTSAGLGIVITLFMSRGYEAIMNHIHNMPPKAVKIIGVSLVIVIIIDFIVSFATMYIRQGNNIHWIRQIRRLF